MRATGKTPFGRWLVREMHRLRHTDRTLAEMFPKPLTHTTVGRWRRGEAEPSPRHIETLAKILEVEPRLIYTLLGRISPLSMEGLTPDQQFVIDSIASRLTQEQVRTLHSLVSAWLEQLGPYSQGGAAAQAVVPSTCG
ncbi:MAG TPA: hypothetical protein VMW58_04595 [Anaerolineae bacterium]|nr:hypothetical protein [Anaerolineae bacterium]